MTLPNTAASAEKNPISDQQPSNRRILVLDDDSLFLSLLKRGASLYNMELVTCRSLEEFIRQNVARKNSIVLLDQNLELMDAKGKPVTGDRLVDLVDSGVIYLMSADANAVLAAKRRGDKFAGFLPKSLGIQEILRVLSDTDLEETTRRFYDPTTTIG